jgi:inhibitor of KinA sporulation pathway (predicted exonuclease)
MKYDALCSMLNEDVTRLPPAHQSWHDFDRVFFSDSTCNMEEFIVEYLEVYSRYQSFFEDEDNSCVRQTVDEMGIRFIKAIEECVGLGYSEIIKRLAPLLYE